jgi:hypothetical protein
MLQPELLGLSFEISAVDAGVAANAGRASIEAAAQAESTVFRIAHGTSQAYVESVAAGLDAAAARAASLGGELLPGQAVQKGTFFAFEIGPPGNAGEGIQLAYEFALRHGSPAVMIGELPQTVVDELIANGGLRVLELQGAPLPQLVFNPQLLQRSITTFAGFR